MPRQDLDAFTLTWHGAHHSDAVLQHDGLETNTTLPRHSLLPHFKQKAAKQEYNAKGR